jgi:hypothetical protein
MAKNFKNQTKAELPSAGFSLPLPAELPAPGRKPVRKVVDYKPAGSYILVELLEAKEVLNTQFSLAGNTPIETPQAYVLAFGPSLDYSKFGVNVGDRIALSGGFVPLPKGTGERQKGLIDVNSVRAVLVESQELQTAGSSLLIS